MKYIPSYGKKLTILLCALLVAGTIGCSSRSSTQALGLETVAIPNSGPTAPGAVEYIWEEPMIDVVNVPPGLDPEGNYYRPAHQEVIEIRQGRWRYYKKQ